ncbi:hypothetical protein Q75_16955 [Bacillus coahuilensis p1.1.43]|uniref:SGNH hydrolase-type esterase domain-containing protein n=1 Tax=Bacillus coahuilensis p1.1.43 TaxID=1150625 RepID=A0A147K3Z8_9BACI|nr:GDSL-type esterase/lipase family protein [Bacillus coahuilensis]KUP04004.1 hypothetical protein Q75_16955 [Bacillus coahuilensis p1.1.43]
MNTYLPYVAVGDSLTVGVGIPLFHFGFVERYAVKTEKYFHGRVPLQKFARIGATTDQILHMMSLPNVSSHLEKAEIISITAGGNDLIQGARAFLVDKDEEKLKEVVKKAIVNIDKMIDVLEEYKRDARDDTYIIRVVNVYNPLPEIELADLGIRKFNQHLEGFTKKPYIEVVDVYSAFKGKEEEYLSLDGIHPNERGYEVMALAVYETGYGLLSKQQIHS